MRLLTAAVAACTILLTGALTGCASSASAAVPVSKVQIIAHRGGAGEHPQESLQAITAAGKLGTPVEFDLVTLKDGGWALAHDMNVDRTLVGKKGKVGALTRKQWRSSCIKGPGTKCGTPITWSQAIKAVPKKTVLVPEIKDPKITPAIMASVLKRYGVLNRTVVQTFDPKTAKALGKLGVKTVLLIWAEDVAGTDWAALKRSGVDYAGLDSHTSAKDAARPLKAGVKVWVWEVHDKAAATTWAKRGASGIFTDYPRRMQQQLK